MLVVKMVLVFGLLGFTLWWIRRYDGKRLRGGQRHSGRPVEVMGQARLSKGASVAVVRIGSSTYAVGVTDHGVSLLAQEPVVVDLARGPALNHVHAAVLAQAGELLAQSQAGRPSFFQALRSQIVAPHSPGRADGSAGEVAGSPFSRVTLTPGSRRFSPSPARTPQV